MLQKNPCRRIRVQCEAKGEQRVLTREEQARVRGAAADAPLIPKKRYEFMDRYFKSSGRYGINMMRGTASTQVSIDFVNEWDFVRKYRFAYLIMPAIKLICDNLYLVELASGDDLPTKLSATAGVLSQTEAFPEGTPAVIDMADPAVSSAVVSHNVDISLDA